MADFAITLWVWEQTGSVTALALTGFFYQFPRIFTSLFAGILVDRVSRKRLLIMSEGVAAVSTLVLWWLQANGQLTIGHFYAAAWINGGFEKFGQLAYRSSISMLVKPQNYTRASSMTTAASYGANIVAPAIGGILYPVLGLGGILPINFATFVVAIITIALLNIPQPQREDRFLGKATSWLTAAWQEVTFGFRYLWNSVNLRTLLMVTALFGALLKINDTLYNPMILARTDGSSQILGAISAIAGLGGITGAIIVSIWGGFERNKKGMLLGYISVGFAKVAFGLGQGIGIWFPAQFWAFMTFPLIWGSESALWMMATPAKVQGRVFAVSFLADDLLHTPIGLFAGVLSDLVLEPAMQSSVVMQKVFSPVTGSGAGSGMALLYVGSAIAMILIGMFGFKFTHIQQIKKF